MKTKLLKYVGYGVTVAAFAFLARSVASMHLDFSRLINPFAAVSCGLILSLGYAGIVYLSAYAWKMVLEFIHGSKISYRDVTGVYIKANLGKYFPGNVMHFAGRNLLAGKLGFKQMDVTFSSAVEVLALIATAVIWSILLALQRFTSILGNILNRTDAAVFGVIAAFLFGAAVLGWAAITKGSYLQKYRRFFTRGFLKLLGKLFSVYSLTLIIPGIFLVMIFALVLGFQVTPQNALVIISAYIISWVAGFIVPGAPGGMGVRESVLLLVLGPMYSGDLAVLAAILHRLASMLGDAAAFLVESGRRPK